MKKVGIALIFLIITATVFAQSAEVFRVVVVSGQVDHAKLKRPVLKGDKISAGESLIFGTKTSFIIVISPKTGRKKIRGVPDPSPRELENLIQSFLTPDEKSTASRGMATEYWALLNESLRDTVLILGDGIITLDKDYIPLAPPAVVVAFYKGKQNEHVTKVLSSGQNICLGKKCLMNDGVQQIHSKVMIEYYLDERTSQELPGSGEFIGYFWPRYGDDAKIEEEIKIIIEALGKSPHDRILSEIKKFLGEEYGHVQEQNLISWLHSKKLLTP